MSGKGKGKGKVNEEEIIVISDSNENSPARKKPRKQSPEEVIILNSNISSNFKVNTTSNNEGSSRTTYGWVKVYIKPYRRQKVSEFGMLADERFITYGDAGMTDPEEFVIRARFEGDEMQAVKFSNKAPPGVDRLYKTAYLIAQKVTTKRRPGWVNYMGELYDDVVDLKRVSSGPSEKSKYSNRFRRACFQRMIRMMGPDRVRYIPKPVHMAMLRDKLEEFVAANPQYSQYAPPPSPGGSPGGSAGRGSPVNAGKAQRCFSEFCSGDFTLANWKACYKRLLLRMHPNKGGSEEQMAKLNDCNDTIKQYFAA